MAFVPGFNSRVLVGPLAYSTYARGFSIDSSTNMLDVTTLASAGAMAYIPGQTDATVSLDLLLDASGAATDQFVHLNTWAGTPAVETLALNGTATGSSVWLLKANQSQASVMSAVADVVTVAVTIQADGGVDYGVSVEDLTAITTTTSGTARDGAAASTNGGVAHLHATAFSGLTSDVVTIEHSVNGSTSWATLVTFATVSGVTAERVVVAPGTAVRQFLRVVDTVTGVGSCTRQVSFARR